MNLHKSKIEWCTHTWNPVTGCRHGCPYCYARSLTRRFEPHTVERPMAPGVIVPAAGSPGCFVVSEPVKLMDELGRYTRSTVYPKGFAPTFSRYTLDYPAKRLIPSRIFVSSMGDLFGEWVPDEWIGEVFKACQKAPWHTYLFLTKNPDRYYKLAKAGKLPQEENFWYGSTITGPNTPFFTGAYNVFLSIEPLVEPFSQENMDIFFSVDWAIIGAMTGPGSKGHQPEREWAEAIVEAARNARTPVFMKDSLKPIWGDNLIREYPKWAWPEAVEVKALGPIPHCKDCEQAEATPQGQRGTAYACEIGWDAEGYDDRGARPIPGRYTRTSPPWCPKRQKNASRGGN